MPEIKIRSDSVNSQEIMQRVRSRIAEKRGVDYTEQDVQRLAAARMETLFEPQKVRSDLIEEIRRVHMDPNTELGEDTLFGSSKPWLRAIRRLLRPVLKLFVNTTPLVHASMVRNGDLFAELVHNLVVETTRLNLEVKSLKMRVESLSSRMDFDERRERALEGVVQYKPKPPAERAGAPIPRDAAPLAVHGDEEEEGEGNAARPRRRRRRRGRRGGGQPSEFSRAAGDDNSPEAGAHNVRNETRPEAVMPPEAEPSGPIETRVPADRDDEQSGS